jgi:N-acetylmuramoyl-L-alanine amidase
MRLKKLALFLLILTAGCATRQVPDEITAMSYKEKSVVIKKKGSIVLDAGHGGRDSGAASHRDDYEEKALTLSTTFLVQEELKKLGYDVILTRSHDTYVPLNTRAQIANNHHADLFVSIHYNFALSEEVNGIEIFYYKKPANEDDERLIKSKKLAQKVLTAVIENTQSASRGVKQANFAVIRETHMPAILVEAGFLSNRQERLKIKDPRYLKALAAGIAKGVDNYNQGNVR